MHAIRLAAVVSVVALAACTPSLIPGTQVRDTEDNRAILQVVRQYREAFEAKDTKAIVQLTSPKYLDARASISHDTLQAELDKDFAKVKDVRLDLSVRRIEVEGDRAQVDYFYSEAFLLDAADQQWKRESDEKRMALERQQDGQWRIVAGL